jgi:hypothetical protein
MLPPAFDPPLPIAPSPSRATGDPRSSPRHRHWRTGRPSDQPRSHSSASGPASVAFAGDRHGAPGLICLGKSRS